MSRFIVQRSSVIVVLALIASAAFALDVPPAPTQWFTDRAGLISVSDADALNQKLQNFEQQSGAQFIIYVLPSLEGESMEDFTIRCVEKWKVGQKKYDNGLVLFVFVQDKKLRIETGYGLEGTITDAFSSRVIRDVIAPKFQQSDWAGGLNAGADAIIAKISKGEEPVPPMQRTGSGNATQDSIPPWVILLIVFFVFFVLVPALTGRRRRSGCGGCFWPMFFFPGGGGGYTIGRGGGGFGGGFGGGGFGGFSGGGGSFGGGGASGGW